MKTIHYIIGAAFMALLITSCETVVEVELPERDSKLVLNSLFSSDTGMALTLSKSKGILEAGDLEFINNGHIEVRGSDGSYAQVNGTGSGTQTVVPYVYYLSLKPKANVSYTVKASTAGFETVSATDALPPAVEIDDIDTATIRFFDSENPEVSIAFTDPANVSNFYEVKLYLIIYATDSDTNGNGTILSVQEVPFYISNEGLFSDGLDERIFTDELFNGSRFTVRLTFEDSYEVPVEGDSIPANLQVFLMAELRNASEDYYKFNSSYLRYQSSVNDPFAQPVQVYNNVEGGFGIFAGYSYDRDTIRVH